MAHTAVATGSASGIGEGTALPLRVIQCGTGLAGGQALAAILERPELTLAGLLVHSEGNDGRDAASFVGRSDCGVRATRDVKALIATPADIVVYMMLVPSLDDINPPGVATAMAVINSLWAVVEAPAGPLTAADLPQPRWRGGRG